MAAPWFHVESLPVAGEKWLLGREEARHATGAKRLAPGDDVVLFDGTGRVALGELGSERLRDGSLPVVVASVETRERRGRRVHLVTALPKGDRMSTLVDMTTQLGVASIAPLRCERSVVTESDARADRMRRIQIEACKQARWAWLPEQRPECKPADMIQRVDQGPLVVAHPGGRSAGEVRERCGDAVTLCIGPEGGFTDAELHLFDAAGAERVDLGLSMLRIETAAVVGCALLRE